MGNNNTMYVVSKTKVYKDGTEIHGVMPNAYTHRSDATAYMKKQPGKEIATLGEIGVCKAEAGKDHYTRYQVYAIEIKF